MMNECYPKTRAMRIREAKSILRGGRSGSGAAEGIGALESPVGDLLEELGQLGGNLARIEAHHAQRLLVVENHRQDRALADEGQLDVVLLALLEHDGEFFLAQQ